MTYKEDKNGYLRGKIEHTDLIHRQKAYRNIYLKNRDKYPLPFSKYVVHHKDFNKKNNKISNLKILTPEEHRRIHNIEYKSQTSLSDASFDSEDRPKYIKETPDDNTTIFFKLIFIAIIIILIGGSLFFMFNSTKHKPLPLTNPPTAPPEVKPFIVEGSKTDVIITNNLERNISLNVTYRIYSTWFGADYTQSKVFNVGANTQQTFKVYDNVGCSSSPCSVIIVSYNEI